MFVKLSAAAPRRWVVRIVLAAGMILLPLWVVNAEPHASVPYKSQESANQARRLFDYAYGSRDARLSLGFLTVAPSRYDVEGITRGLRAGVTDGLTIQAAGMFCCDFCEANYERCIQNGGDEETCANMWCACMLGCGVCPIC